MSGTGSVSIAVHIKAAPGQVQSVRVIIAAPDIALPIESELSQEGPESWQSTVSAIPAGPSRAFTAQARGAMGEILYQGSAQADLLANQTAVVSMLLQEVTPPISFANSAPYLTSLVASTSRTTPVGQVDLWATATDPDGDPLTYAWSATGGGYDAASDDGGTLAGASTTWTAPAAEGSYTLTVEVSDGRGGQSSITLTVQVWLPVVDVDAGDEGPGCVCQGTGPGGVAVEVTCGQTACGSDFFMYLCSEGGWLWTGEPCPGSDDAGADADADICACEGTGPGGVSVTAACGESACGSDYTLYECSASGWLWTGEPCPGSGDAGADSDGGNCACEGTGPGGEPVTAACGESACGSDYTLYECSASGWSWTGEPCPGTCACEGTGPGGYPVTAACGESACGSDYILYACSAAGWTWTGQACTCECVGTGPGGVPVTVLCGESACGSDYTLYACSAAGWSWTGQVCTGNEDAGVPCECHGTGPGGVPVAVACGQSACGSDFFLYACIDGAWSHSGQPCDGDAGSP